MKKALCLNLIFFVLLKKIDLFIGIMNMLLIIRLKNIKFSSYEKKKIVKLKEKKEKWEIIKWKQDSLKECRH